ncbi:MAG: DUF502 domain-containing protein [Pseudomonadota bacterium]|jgi:uncharacterized membrane protein
MDRIRHALVLFVRMVAVGALTLAPLLVTVWLAVVLFDLTAALGAALLRPATPWLVPEALFEAKIVRVVVALAVLAGAGALVGSAVGRRIGAAANHLIDRTPVVKTVYRSVEKLLHSFRTDEDDARNVVLIEFPSPEMKAVGLVTRRFTAADTGQELAAVYVPTTPNPSSGYIEIVPVERLVWLDWSAQEAIQFIMSGGVVGPEHIRYNTEPPARLDPIP